MVIPTIYTVAMCCIKATHKWYKAKLGYCTHKGGFIFPACTENGTRQETLKTRVTSVIDVILGMMSTSHMYHKWGMPLNAKNADSHNETN